MTDTIKLYLFSSERQYEVTGFDLLRDVSNVSRARGEKRNDISNVDRAMDEERDDILNVDGARGEKRYALPDLILTENGTRRELPFQNAGGMVFLDCCWRKINTVTDHFMIRYRQASKIG